MFNQECTTCNGDLIYNLPEPPVNFQYSDFPEKSKRKIKLSLQIRKEQVEKHPEAKITL